MPYVHRLAHGLFVFNSCIIVHLYYLFMLLFLLLLLVNKGVCSAYTVNVHARYCAAVVACLHLSLSLYVIRRSRSSACAGIGRKEST